MKPSPFLNSTKVENQQQVNREQKAIFLTLRFSGSRGFKLHGYSNNRRSFTNQIATKISG